MVPWNSWIIILAISCLTCAKTEDLQEIPPSSIDLMQREFRRYCAKIPGCRYSEFLSKLSNSLNVDAAGTSSYKVKKNSHSDSTEVLASDSLEGRIPSGENVLKFEELDNLVSSYDDSEFFKDDQVKRGHNLPSTGCDCRKENALRDLGPFYYPRYLLNVICQKDEGYPPKCFRGTQCRPLEYKVRVLTHRSSNDHLYKDPTAFVLPEALRSLWKFETVTIAAGCFCS